MDISWFGVIFLPHLYNIVFPATVFFYIRIQKHREDLWSTEPQDFSDPVSDSEAEAGGVVFGASNEVICLHYQARTTLEL